MRDFGFLLHCFLFTLKDCRQSSFISPNFITPFLRINSDAAKVIPAGRINSNNATARVITHHGLPFDASIKPKTPTKPLVPIPPPEALQYILKTQVATGPKIALEITSGTIIIGFFIMLGI